jgi:hypothetical protein
MLVKRRLVLHELRRREIERSERKRTRKMQILVELPEAEAPFVIFLIIVAASYVTQENCFT